MDNLQLKIIQTIALLLGAALLYALTNKLVNQTIVNSLLKKARGKIIKKGINILTTSICFVFILIVWGVDQSELSVFVGSLIAVVGIAMFAQWSILSNITSSIIIYFNHSVGLEDTITIIDKDYEIEGRVSDIGLFFVIIKTKEGELISVPCNVFIQKMIKKKIDD